MSTINITQLPDDILIEILKQLNFHDLSNCITVNRSFFSAIKRYRQLFLRRSVDLIRIERHWEKNLKFSILDLDGLELQFVLFEGRDSDSTFPEYKNITLFKEKNWICQPSFYPNESPMAFDCLDLEKSLERVMRSILTYTTSYRIEMRNLPRRHQDAVKQCLHSARYPSEQIKSMN